MEDFYTLEAQQSRLALLQSQHSPSSADTATLPSPAALQTAESSFTAPGSPSYLTQRPAEAVVQHITQDIIPALNGQGRSPRYYGFVTGGVLPIAEWADNVVSHVDQNVQVHLPEQTVATRTEDEALRMLATLLRLDAAQWEGRTMTTGATGSNILGLACGREAVLAHRLRGSPSSVGELGLLGACAKAGVTEMQVLTSAGHSSLSKAASVVGLGRASVRDVSVGGEEPWRMDLDAVEGCLREPGVASIIAVSCGEVNTGRYGVRGLEDMKRLRALADEHGAWIHVDGGKKLFLFPFGLIGVDLDSIWHLRKGSWR